MPNNSKRLHLLFISNLYPPYSRGGYEQWCREVAEELARRGHQITVLTTATPNQPPTASAENGVNVHRALHPEVEGGLKETVFRLLFNRKQLEQENLDYVQSLIEQTGPDAALIWGMWNMPRSVPALIETLLPNRVAYFLCDYWLSLPNAYIQRWQVPARGSLTQIPKRLLGYLFLKRLEKEDPIKLKLKHPICVSRAVRTLLVEAGVPIEHAQVIYGGTQAEDFVEAAKNRHASESNTLRLLYVGRLDEEKGVRTIIKALAILAEKEDIPSITLDIYGTGNPDYEAELKALAHSERLNNNITFKGTVPRSEIPGVFAHYDSLIFSSEWEEPFARTVLEAMASGLVVIGTTTGGTGEILVDGDTGLTYEKGDAHTLAEKISRLSDDSALRQKLAQSGQQRVLADFRFSRMVNQIEETLFQVEANATQ